MNLRVSASLRFRVFGVNSRSATSGFGGLQLRRCTIECERCVGVMGHDEGCGGEHCLIECHRFYFARVCVLRRLCALRMAALEVYVSKQGVLLAPSPCATSLSTGW